MTRLPIPPQLPLSLGLKDSTLFANYIAGDNLEAMSYLQTLEQQPAVPGIYLWGPAGVGKSHLLQAICHAAGQRSAAAFYLPLRAADDFPYEALQGLEAMAVVCIDDIDAIAGSQRWDEVLLQLFERIQQTGSRLVVTGGRLPSELALDPALASRLAWGMIFQLKPLSAVQKRQALQLRADRRGLRLAQDAARLLVRHFGDDMGLLFECFERLDNASLAAKRKLTVAFIRQVLDLDER